MDEDVTATDLAQEDTLSGVVEETNKVPGDVTVVV
jgi:hypothetical protein